MHLGSQLGQMTTVGRKKKPWRNRPWLRPPKPRVSAIRRLRGRDSGSLTQAAQFGPHGTPTSQRCLGREGGSQVTESRRGVGSGFHELPLVFFTALATGGAGIGVSHVGIAAVGWVPWLPSQRVLALLITLLGVGLLFSMGHLGRPMRGPLALVRVGRSSLSNEVLIVGIALVAGLIGIALPAGHALRLPVTLAASVASLPVLLALGLVYRLPGQLTWRGMAVLHPLILGTGFGLTLLLGSLPLGAQARGELLVLLILLMDGLLVWERSRRIVSALRKGLPGHPGLMGQRGSALILRVLLGILLPAVALLSGWRELAGLSLFLNLLFDRFLFYGLAVRQTTEFEVMKVESALTSPGIQSRGSMDSALPFIPADES